MALNILSVICQGLGSMEKRLDVFNYLKQKQCQIYCLQDTHTTKISENFFRSQWNSECLFSSGKSNARGVAILFSKNLEYEIHSHISDSEVNLYGPNQDTPSFFDTILNKVTTIGNTNLIICGDFNTVHCTKCAA